MDGWLVGRCVFVQALRDIATAQQEEEGEDHGKEGLIKVVV